MSFWTRKKKSSSRSTPKGDRGRAQQAKKTVKRSPPVPMEVKILAIEALDSGLSASEVGELVGVGPDADINRPFARRAASRGLESPGSSVDISNICVGIHDALRNVTKGGESGVNLDSHE